MNSVLCGRICSSTFCNACPSTLLTKWKRLPYIVCTRNACTAMHGPRSEPPMPMLTTSVMAGLARTDSANARNSSLVACTASQTGMSEAGSPDGSGVRSNQCMTCRCSLALMTSPANMASRNASTCCESASFSSCSQTSASTWDFEPSMCSNSPAGSCRVRLKRSSLPGSSANAARKSKPCAPSSPGTNLAASACKAFQARLWSSAGVAENRLVERTMSIRRAPASAVQVFQHRRKIREYLPRAFRSPWHRHSAPAGRPVHGALARK